MNRIEYTVRGRWPFPPDMLRYDDSRPVDLTNQSLVTALSGEFMPAVAARKMFDVVLVAETERRNWVPAFERWSSFGWEVTQVDGAPIERIGGTYIERTDLRTNRPAAEPAAEPAPYAQLREALAFAADWIAKLQREGCPAGPVAIPSQITDALR